MGMPMKHSRSSNTPCFCREWRSVPRANLWERWEERPAKPVPIGPVWIQRRARAKSVFAFTLDFKTQDNWENDLKLQSMTLVRADIAFELQNRVQRCERRRARFNRGRRVLLSATVAFVNGLLGLFWYRSCSWYAGARSRPASVSCCCSWVKLWCAELGWCRLVDGGPLASCPTMSEPWQAVWEIVSFFVALGLVLIC